MKFKQKIVVIEDEFIIASSIKEILEEENYEVYINFATAEKGIAAIKELKPNLVLIDINLNGLKDGIDVGYFLLEDDKIPFLYITSSTDNLTLDRAKETRPVGYVVKPFSAVSLKATVAIAINNYRYRHVDVCRNDLKISSDVSFRIKIVLTHISQHLTEPLHNDQLAILTKWQTHHFIRIFKHQMAVTPHQYILNKRIEKACLLLTENKTNIKSIAFELGFISNSNFSTIFKKIMKQTPDQYRLNKIMETNM